MPNSPPATYLADSAQHKEIFLLICSKFTVQHFFFSVLISHARQLSDFLLALSMNLDHPVNRH